jgi:hypothetical protein
MPHADDFPNGVLDTIVVELGKLGAYAGTHIHDASGVELRETFAVWMLGADAVTKSTTDIKRLALNTGQWHHQLAYDGQPRAYARSVPLGPRPTDWSVRSLFESHIAQKIDEAIVWTDDNVQDDALVRLLICPAFYIHAFWLVRNDSSQILVVDMPDQFTHLKYVTLYTPQEFLKTLALEH